MRVFCFDSGNAHLGVAVLDILDWRTELARIGGAIRGTRDLATIAQHLCAFEHMVDHLVSIKMASTVSLLGSAPTLRASDLPTRTGALKAVLADMDRTWGPPDVVLLEDQMRTNLHSNVVNAQILYHFYSQADVPPVKIVTLNARLKNSIMLDKAAACTLPKTKYCFNKALALRNYAVLSARCGHVRAQTTKPRADEADAVMMGFAYALERTPLLSNPDMKKAKKKSLVSRTQAQICNVRRI